MLCLRSEHSLLRVCQHSLGGLCGENVIVWPVLIFSCVKKKWQRLSCYCRHDGKGTSREARAILLLHGVLQYFHDCTLVLTVNRDHSILSTVTVTAVY